MTKIDHVREMVIQTRLDELSDEDILYFKENPNRLYSLTSTGAARRAGLWAALAMAILLVAGSKIIAFRYGDETSQFFNDVIVSLVFEMGAALIGSVVTILFIDMQRDRQIRENRALRQKIKDRIAALGLVGIQDSQTD